MSDTPVDENEDNTETEGETEALGTAEKLRRKIDDLIDKLEDTIGELPAIPQAIALQGVGVIRAVLQIPDDIGGDAD